MKYVEALRSLQEAPAISDLELARFSSNLEFSEATRGERLNRALARDFSDPMDIVRWIVAAKDEGYPDEALWRGFLGAHFGEPLAESAAARSAGMLLCALGTSAVWVWSRIFESPTTLLKWLLERRADLEELQFGNHRKFEAKQPKLLYDVVWSFVLWVRLTGGSPSAAFATKEGTAEERFDILFHRLDSLNRFGRLGKFDLLCLYADLELLPIRPGSCYLVGASGPLDAAKRLWGRRTAKELSRIADTAALRIGVPFAVFEDALCNWQKE